MHSQLIPFLGVVALITVTPGADTAVVVRNALRHGSRGGLATAAGSASGLLVWGAAAAVGIAALLSASAVAFTTVKLVGAAYLILLGLQAIRHAGADAVVGDGRRAPLEIPAGRAFRQGLATNLLNPKAALFFTALLPQFVSPQDPVLAVSALMTAIASAASFTWLGLYSWVLPAVGDLVARSAVRRRIDRCTGAVLIALGVRVAIEHR